MIKKILFLSMMLPLFLFARHDSALKINNKNLILEGNYNFLNSHNSDYYLGANVQSKSHKGLTQAELIFKVLNNQKPYRLGLGVNTTWLDLDDSKDVFAIPLNAYFTYYLENMGVDFNIGYAPEILINTSNKNVNGILNTKIEFFYNVIPNSDILLGYKNNYIFMSAQSNESINQTAYLGLRFHF